uniref:Annexin n=1 Tax=Phallusia mammillata TaxID=59560 RepID=A0A6F9D7C2_9ASCI|nr:annexin A7-like [Phallusia mammillata]
MELSFLFSGFNAEADAQALRKAMKGLGTNEKTIIEIAGNRSLKQRLEIVQTYKQAFGRDLLADLKSEIGGKFRDLTLALFTALPMFDVQSLHGAMKGIGTKESVLTEILASRSNAQIKEIRELYKKHHKVELEKALTSETSGDFRRLLVSFNNAARDETNQVNEGKAVADAEALYKAGEKKLGTDEAVFNSILCTRSYPQLRATFREYQKIAKKDILKSIESEFSGDAEDALKAVVVMARSPAVYFAQCLYKSMKGAGTNDSALIRLVVTRCEVDMVEIKEQFVRLFKSPLPKVMAGDTSGDYEKLLLKLVGN